ncbi:MAG: DUF4945 domain-containing protein [Prolixibacteraceae bacterium]
MKNIIKIVVVTFIAIQFTGCYDRDIVDLKEFDHSLPKVENLEYTKQGDQVNLTWKIPAAVSADFKRPLEVSIQVVENNIYRQKVIVGNENTSASIATNASKKYRFVVKLLGYLTDQAREEGKTDRVYSEGQVIEIE